MSAPDGLLVIDKPQGWTSHDVVARTRGLAHTRKVGHAGTLDPMATGVLVLGIGRATRLLGHLSLANKCYDATVLLGVTTSTDDAEGEILARCAAAAITDAQLARAVTALTGQLAQVPSAVSAIKVDGVRSYARVRSGQTVELAARPVTVSRFQVRARRGDALDVTVEVSSGTYVRALARDLGQALGVGAHLTALRRTRVGDFGLAAAHSLDELAVGEEVVHAAVLRLDDAVRRCLPVRALTDQQALDLSYGRPLPPTGETGTVGGFAPGGRCIALLEDRDGVARPTVVFAPA